MNTNVHKTTVFTDIAEPEVTGVDTYTQMCMCVCVCKLCILHTLILMNTIAELIL